MKHDYADRSWIHDPYALQPRCILFRDAICSTLVALVVLAAFHFYFN